MQFPTRFLCCSVDEVDHLIQVLLENGLKSVFVIANCLLLFAFALGKHVTMNCLPAFSPEVKDRIYQMFREGEPLIAQARDFCLYVAHKLKTIRVSAECVIMRCLETGSYRGEQASAQPLMRG